MFMVFGGHWPLYEIWHFACLIWSNIMMEASFPLWWIYIYIYMYSLHLRQPLSEEKFAFRIILISRIFVILNPK